MRHALLGQRCRHDAGNITGARVNRRVNLRAAGSQRRQTRGNGQRVARQRPGLIHGSDRGEMGHHLTPATEGRRGQPTAHDLAEGEQIRRPSLDGAFRPPPAGRPDPKTGHHLIQDEQCPVGVTKPAQSRVETRQRRDNSHVGGGGFGDDSGDLIGIPDEHRLDGTQVVVGHDDRFRRGGGGHARRFRQAEGRHSRTSRGKQGVDMTMVAASELYDL